MADLTAVDAKTEVHLFDAGETVTWTLTGSFTGSAVLESSESPDGGWKVLQTLSSATSSTYKNEGQRRWFRVSCTAIGEAETITAVITSATTDTAYEFKDTEGVTRLKVTDAGVEIIGTASITGATTATGGVTGALVGTAAAANQLTGGLQALTASGAVASSSNVVTLSKTGGGIAGTIAAPAAGRFLVVTQVGAETEGHTVKLTAGTYDGTNNTATFNAAGETLVLIGLSTTRFLILSNIGAVGLSST